MVKGQNRVNDPASNAPRPPPAAIGQTASLLHLGDRVQWDVTHLRGITMLEIGKKLFGKRSGEARQALAVMTNRNLMQASVYGVFYVASADGDIEKEELEKIEKLINNSAALKGFGAELSNTIDRAKADFNDGGPRIIRQNAEKELKDLAHSVEDAATVLNFMLTVAEADGEIEAAEMVVLEKAAKIMNLNLKDHL
jgi:tellurite resistance protein TerB